MTLRIFLNDFLLPVAMIAWFFVLACLLWNARQPQPPSPSANPVNLVNPVDNSAAFVPLIDRREEEPDQDQAAPILTGDLATPGLTAQRYDENNWTTNAP